MNKKGINWPYNQPLFPDAGRYVVIDVENMNPYADIIQIAAVEVLDLKIKKQLFHNIKPLCKRVNPFCAKVHGIKLSDVRYERTFQEFCPDLMDFVGNSPIIAHNRAAEYKSLLFEFNQIRMDLPFPIDNFFCSMKMARKLGITGGLREMARQVGISVDHLRQEHDALSDTLVAAELFIKMQKFRQNNELA